MNNNQSEKINLKIPVPGEIFSNEKGQKYQIVTVAKHVVTKETLVIYQALYGDFDMRALPLERFITRKTEAKVIENTTNINERVNSGSGNVSVTVDKDNPGNQRIVVRKNKNEALYNNSKNVKEIKVEDFKDECPEGMNLLLYAFLETDTVHDKLKLIKNSDNRKYIDNKCVDDMAACMDFAIDEGDIDERIRQLITCLDTMKSFEVLR